MSSDQATLSEATGSSTVAEELAQDQQSISIAEFFEKNKHMLGFDSKSRAIVTAVKEAVDNALDATEEAGILPEISVEIDKVGDYYRVAIEDNGPGITEEQLPKIFGQLLYGSRFHAREQNRGQQGIGISATVLYSQMTSGQPTLIRSKTASGAYEMSIKIDTDTNKPVVENKREIEWDEKSHGTRIELEMEANMRGRKQLHRYIEDTALVNPHAEISLEEPDWDFHSERVTGELPPDTEEIQPHPHGIDIGTLKEMLDLTDSQTLKGFLQSDFTRVGAKTADNILELAQEHYRDHHTGRSLSWNTDKIIENAKTVEEIEVGEDEEDEVEQPEPVDLEEIIYDAINGKSPETKEALAECVYEKFTNVDQVTYRHLSEMITDCARTTERQQDERIGPAVQDAVLDTVWKFVRGHREDQVVELVDSATSKRKSKEAIEVMAKTLEEVIMARSDSETFTEEEIRNCISIAADETESETGTSIGSTAREKIFDEVWDIAVQSDDELPELSDILADRNAVESLLEGMDNAKVMAPPTKCLSPITPERMKAGLEEMFEEADMYSSTKRDGAVHKGSPFIVEAGVAYGEDLQGVEDKIDLRRFANRVPLVYQQGACAITQVTESINWRNYKLKQTGGSGSMPRGPMVLMVHIASTNVPFTSESKDAVSSAEVLEDEIEKAIREVARDVKSHVNKQRDLKKRQEKRDTVGDIIPPMAESLANVVETDEPDESESIARIMNNLYVGFNEGEITLENNQSKSMDLVITSSDEEYEVSISSGETETLEVGDPDDLTITGIEAARVTVSDDLAGDSDKIVV